MPPLPCSLFTESIQHFSGGAGSSFDAHHLLPSHSPKPRGGSGHRGTQYLHRWAPPPVATSLVPIKDVHLKNNQNFRFQENIPHYPDPQYHFRIQILWGRGIFYILDLLSPIGDSFQGAGLATFPENDSKLLLVIQVNWSIVQFYRTVNKVPITFFHHFQWGKQPIDKHWPKASKCHQNQQAQQKQCETRESQQNHGPIWQAQLNQCQIRVSKVNQLQQETLLQAQPNL